MKDITLEEMRELQLNMLDKIHAFCIQNDIRYSLGGGTLLGAIRHKGYIPWDDDVDIMMPRPDYEKFLKGFEGFHENLILQHYKNDDSYYYPFAKIYDNRTLLIEPGARNGIYIDVFPIDGLPPFEQIPKFLDQYNHYIDQLFRTTKFYRFKKRLYIQLKYYLRKFYTPSRKVVIANLENLLFANDFEKAEFAGAIVGRYGEKEAMKAVIFRNYTQAQFEGRYFNIIVDYDAYLKQHYGNYMQLPPIEQQISNHQFEAYWNA